MNKQVMIFGIVAIVLIAAVMCAGCSSTNTGVSSASGGKSFPLETYDAKGEEIKITTTIILPANSGLEIVGEPVTPNYEMSSDGRQMFGIYLKNVGSSSVTITGARVTQNGNGVIYNYAHFHNKDKAPTTTIEPGQTRGCLWLSPSVVRGDQNYVVEIFAAASGSGETAKAQTGTTVKSTPAPTPTVRATATVAAVVTQTGDIYYSSLISGDYERAKTVLMFAEMMGKDDKRLEDTRKDFVGKGIVAVKITEIVIEEDGSHAFAVANYLNEKGETIHQEKIGFSKINGVWKKGGFY
jgi:hypothetical protein